MAIWEVEFEAMGTNGPLDPLPDLSHIANWKHCHLIPVNTHWRWHTCSVLGRSLSTNSTALSS